MRMTIQLTEALRFGNLMVQKLNGFEFQIFSFQMFSPIWVLPNFYLNCIALKFFHRKYYNMTKLFLSSSFANKAIIVLSKTTSSKILFFLSCLFSFFSITVFLLLVSIDFSELVVSSVFFVSCLDKFTGVHEIININI